MWRQRTSGPPRPCPHCEGVEQLQERRGAVGRELQRDLQLRPRRPGPGSGGLSAAGGGTRAGTVGLPSFKTEWAKRSCHHRGPAVPHRAHPERSRHREAPLHSLSRRPASSRLRLPKGRPLVHLAHLRAPAQPPDSFVAVDFGISPGRFVGRQGSGGPHGALLLPAPEASAGTSSA